jgi:hypothetical protein
MNREPKIKETIVGSSDTTMLVCGLESMGTRKHRTFGTHGVDKSLIIQQLDIKQEQFKRGSAREIGKASV